MLSKPDAGHGMRMADASLFPEVAVSAILYDLISLLESIAFSLVRSIFMTLTASVTTILSSAKIFLSLLRIMREYVVFRDNL